MNSFVAMTLISVGLVPPFLTAAQSNSSRLLLERLRAERQAAVVDDSRAQGNKPPIDLKTLVGVRRAELVQSLGIPDFCAPPMDAACIKSPHIAYFFYPRKSSIARDMGTGSVDMTVTAGGGWALEVNVSHNIVAKAAWVKQE